MMFLAGLLVGMLVMAVVSYWLNEFDPPKHRKVHGRHTQPIPRVATEEDPGSRKSGWRKVLPRVASDITQGSESQGGARHYPGSRQETPRVASGWRQGRDSQGRESRPVDQDQPGAEPPTVELPRVAGN